MLPTQPLPLLLPLLRSTLTAGSPLAAGTRLPDAPLAASCTAVLLLLLLPLPPALLRLLPPVACGSEAAAAPQDCAR